MATLINSAEIAGKIAGVTPVSPKDDHAADAVIEQMFGYFSFEPMPLEAEDMLQAA